MPDDKKLNEINFSDLGKLVRFDCVCNARDAQNYPNTSGDHFMCPHGNQFWYMKTLKQIDEIDLSVIGDGKE